MLRQNGEKNTRSLLTFYAGQFEKNYTNVARAGDVLDYFLSRDTKERRASYLGAASDGYVTRPNRMSPGQARAYERGLAAAMAQAGTRPLSSLYCASLPAMRARSQQYRSSANLFDHAKHDAN
jgi:hypothetical protein